MKVLYRCLNVITSILFLSLIVVVLIQVSFRYMSHFSWFSWIPLFSWTEELSRFLFIAIISLGSILVLSENGFARIEFVREKFKENRWFFWL